MSRSTKPPITIQVVDDDKEIVESIRDFLSRKGYSVHTAHTAHEGLEQIDRFSVQISLIDYKLPDMTGIDMLKAVKEMAPATLIILISGYASIDATAKAINQGAYDYLAKPFRFDELETVLFRATERIAQTERLRRIRTRNLVLAASLPIWVWLGYLLATYFFR